MRRVSRGFTLLELLVAMTIFLLFIGAVYRTFRAGQTSMVHVETQQDLYQTGRIVLAQLTAELACAYQSASAQTSSLLGEDTEGSPDLAQADQLTFLTTAHAAVPGRAAGDLWQVTYTLGEGTDEEPAGLYVEERFPEALAVADAEPTRYLLSPLVVGFNCKYLPAEDDWEPEWLEQPTLPAAVRIELVLQSRRPGATPLVLVATTNLALATAPATVEGGADAEP
jgi:type II secretion system protein J